MNIYLNNKNIFLIFISIVYIYFFFTNQNINFFVDNNIIEINKENIYSGFGNGGTGNTSKLKENNDMKNIMSILVYITKLIGFIIIIFIGLDVLKMLNEPQKNNSSEGLHLVLKLLAAGLFLNATTIATSIFGIKLVTASS